MVVDLKSVCSPLKLLLELLRNCRLPVVNMGLTLMLPLPRTFRIAYFHT